ncbi:hypothetical protein ACF09J_07785 [Streptomyces sp. NPDC014889]|uniref:hypothetical protein n=1 Tax=Streptomyces sp. NPDC014889 TaxID=3364928 RepID=UPI003700B25F
MERTDQPDQPPTPTQPQPNRILAEPATVQACTRDRGTPADQAARAEDAIVQAETAKWHGRAAAETPRGRR